MLLDSEKCFKNRFLKKCWVLNKASEWSWPSGTVKPIILLLASAARVAMRVANTEPPPAHSMQHSGGLRILVALPLSERCVEELRLHMPDADGHGVLRESAGLRPDACECRKLLCLDLSGRALNLPNALVALALAALVRTDHAAC